MKPIPFDAWARKNDLSEQSKYDSERLLNRLEAVQAKVAAAKARRHDGAQVQLVAVSKTHPVEAIQTLYDAGLRHFGESYVQEWEGKVEALPPDITWHFVGRLQSNKAKHIADRVALVHSADRRSVMKALNRRSEAPMDVLLQVNLGGQRSKGGVASGEIEDLMEMAVSYPNLKVRGLMGMPPYSDDPEENRGYFVELRETLKRLQQYVETHHPERRQGLEELSMGMSNDFGVAIEEGATIIRVGTALFGERDYDE